MNYFERARHRARRRKSPWNLLLIPAVLIPLSALYLGSLLAVEALHLQISPGESLRNAKGFGVILATISPFFGAIPLALILGNFLIWFVPPARNVLDAEAKAFPETSFWNAQKKLFKLSLVMVPVSVALSISGVLLPWTGVK
jgi:hypothetical protein